MLQIWDAIVAGCDLIASLSDWSLGESLRFPAREHMLPSALWGV